MLFALLALRSERASRDLRGPGTTMSGGKGGAVDLGVVRAVLGVEADGGSSGTGGAACGVGAVRGGDAGRELSVGRDRVRGGGRCSLFPVGMRLELRAGLCTERVSSRDGR